MIAWLGSAEASDTARVGGKTATLSLLHGRLRVPAGFVAGTDADADAIRSAAEHLGAVCLAVRSSAYDEDGATTSFAGQHDTFLGVAPAELLDAVARCRESTGSPQAAAYRNHHRLRPPTPLPVLVQELVPADVAAVAFSIDPMTGSASTIVVNANYGLGDSVVSGTATPDTYRVERTSLAVTAALGAKEQMTVLTQRGVAEVVVPKSLRSRRVLDDAAAIEIAQLALEVESELGYAVDIECAVSQGVLYLLQARPVTAQR